MVDCRMMSCSEQRFREGDILAIIVSSESFNLRIKLIFHQVFILLELCESRSFVSHEVNMYMYLV